MLVLTLLFTSDVDYVRYAPGVFHEMKGKVLIVLVVLVVLVLTILFGLASILLACKDPGSATVNPSLN